MQIELALNTKNFDEKSNEEKKEFVIKYLKNFYEWDERDKT